MHVSRFYKEYKTNMFIADNFIYYVNPTSPGCVLNASSTPLPPVTTIPVFGDTSLGVTQYHPGTRHLEGHAVTTPAAGAPQYKAAAAGFMYNIAQCTGYRYKGMIPDT